MKIKFDLITLFYPSFFMRISIPVLCFSRVQIFECRISVFSLHFRSRFSYPQQVLNSLQSGLANLPFSHLDRAHVPYSSDPLPHHSVNNNPVIVATTAATCCVPPEVLITPAPPRSDEELVVTDSGGR